MQNSKYTKNLTIPIPQNILIGKLIGRGGRNIKPIAERTEIPPFKNRINDASSQLNDLINKISKQENKNVPKVTDIVVVNDNLLEKFSKFSKNIKRKCYKNNKPEHHMMECVGMGNRELRRNFQDKIMICNVE
ncbi:hypothetical protein RhiirA5_501923 [Rhizophagus irregularis]|uniref:K Homology domain-containing protein n=1 Tax=Rhizophagus irregularis TaxID=588596 RepID=A0A2N0PFS9_9GLOM|nr:hypothetical protein RhiirA5_501923 [Rhizophagus irregularis]